MASECGGNFGVAARTKGGSGRMADFVETLSFVIVVSSLAGFGLIMAALLMSWVTAAHAHEVLQSISLAQGF